MLSSTTILAVYGFILEASEVFLENFPHYSVLKAEILTFFTPLNLQNFLDGTTGAGGHAESLLEAHPEIMRYFAVDQDPEALGIAEKRLKQWENKVHFHRGNFANKEEISALVKETPLDGILLDLGVSSMQLDRPEKGFSFMNEGPLDMRMDPEASLTAEEIVNTWSIQELGKIFREYGEEKGWRRAAEAIVKGREEVAITTTKQLVDLLHPVLYRYAKKGLHPLTKVFQALRIAVNDELKVVEHAIPIMLDLLRPGGRLAVISFHSLEDRLVKNAFRFAASDKVETSGVGGVFIGKDPSVQLLTRKPVTPGEKELEENRRSRSAKLRVVEKL